MHKKAFSSSFPVVNLEGHSEISYELNQVL